MHSPESAAPFGPDRRAIEAEAILSRLNPAQREAVTHPGGPMLVLAGAGSGKTRVITCRVAYLILGRRVPPGRVFAVTFTNKAAAEMRERVEALLGTRGLGSWIGTFHALCLRILRRDGERVGLEPGFVIYDRDDQLALVKRILKEEAADDVTERPRMLLSGISRAKNALQSPEDLERQAFRPRRMLLARVYRCYEEALRRANALDFDDLLLRTLRLLRGDPAVARAYAERCEHLLVDEYQDTNRPQYLLVRELSRVHGNVCVVGDEDQCIYRFRGAELRNILDFEADHPGTHTVRLEQNYRSTGTILAAAGALIDRNLERKGKSLWTENPGGEPLELVHAPDDRSEAAWVARRVRELEGEHALEQIAVLYRTNAQSRQLEEIFRRERVPFQIVGSVQFYERKEVKDLLAYLKLIANPADDVAFRRVVNTPSRGIGGTTLGTIERVAGGLGIPLVDAAVRTLDDSLLATRPARLVGSFLELIENARGWAEDFPVGVLLTRVIEAVDYESYLNKVYGGLATERMENVRALVSAAAEYSEEEESATLEGFLDRAALVSDADEVGRRPGVTLMTIHCAKGLEFDVVFLVGLEERLFPHAMASGSEEDIEEERRLCYVAMTRARRLLLLGHAACRRFQGQLLPAQRSRFLAEIPSELVRSAGSSPGSFEAWERARAFGGSDGGSSAARARARRVDPTDLPLAAATDRGGVPTDGYAVGAFVRHPSFGGGRILGREGSGRNLKLTIHFADHGAKKILPAYTKLRIQTS